MDIKLVDISKYYAREKVLHQVSLGIRSGQFLTLLGPSGCGKTTLLRIIAGLENFEDGHVLFDGQDTASWSLKERKVGFVFQNYALFKHMRVAENISFGLRMLPRKERPSLAAIRERTEELIRLVQLDGLSQRWPHQLSGGQRQRVALARALAINPQILLLDEPFGALDAKVRKDLRVWLRTLQQTLKITTVLVTHDQDEAFEISDRVVLLKQGRIEQEGSPLELLDQPASPFALNFLGGAQRLSEEQLRLLGESAPHNSDAVSYVRSHELELVRPLAAQPGLLAQVSHISVRGSLAYLSLQLPEGSSSKLLEVEMSRESFEQLSLSLGEIVNWRPRRLHTFTEGLDLR